MIQFSNDSHWVYYNTILGGMQITQLEDKRIDIKVIYQAFIDVSRSYIINFASNIILKYYTDVRNEIQTVMECTRSQQIS